MHLLFVDESGKRDERTFAMGGAVIAARDWQVLQERWDAALDRHGWPHEKEIKSHGTRIGEIPPPLADAVFDAIAGSPITCYVIFLRPLAGRTPYPDFFASDDDTYATGLTFLAERYQRFLSHEDSHGVMVLDSRRPEVDNRTRRFFERLRREGTPYVQLDRIVDSLLLGPSHHSLGLQVADLVVACTRAAQNAPPGDATRWYRQLLPRFARHPDTGELNGVGLVTFPARVKAEEQPSAKLFIS